MSQETKLESARYPLHTIYFYLTSGCNLRCRHCWIEPKFQPAGRGTAPALSPELFRDIITQGRELGLTAVKLTGGEPLIHPEIAAILEIIADTELNLTIETNGVCCTPEMVARINGCRSPFVSVSLDAAEPELHEWVRGVRGCFEQALSGIRNLVSAGLNTQIIMSVMRRNVGQIEPVVRLAEELGVGSVKFNLINPAARGETLQQQGETLSIAELVATGRMVEDELQSRTSIGLLYSHPLAFRPLHRLCGKGDTGGRCGLLGILGVLADGKYALCGIGETVPELVFGDATQVRLAEVWASHPVLQALRTGLPDRLEGVCGECLMKRLCLGSCVAMNYYSQRNLFAPFWYCEEARRAGLFPVSRLRPAGVARETG